MTSHTYEIYLHPPGEGLKSPGEEQSPPTESEVKMKKDEPLVTNPTLFKKFEACNGEKGTLTLITQQRIIRRAYLNNKIIPALVDTCSLVSIVESSDPKFNRFLKTGRKIGMHLLRWRERWRKESTEDDLVLDDKIRFEPRTPVSTSKEDERTKTETSEDPDSGIACASDDPRRGGKSKHTDSKETKAGSSRQAAHDNMSESREVNVNAYTMNQVVRSTEPNMAVNDNDQPDSSTSQKIASVKDNMTPDYKIEDGPFPSAFRLKKEGKHANRNQAMEDGSVKENMTSGNIGNIGNIGNLGDIGNIGNLGSIGNIGNSGNIGSISDSGNLGNIGNIGNLGNIGDIVKSNSRQSDACMGTKGSPIKEALASIKILSNEPETTADIFGNDRE